MFSRSVNDTSGVVRLMIIGDTTTWSITYDHHSDNYRGVIYDHNTFIIQATGYTNQYTINKPQMSKNFNLKYHHH